MNLKKLYVNFGLALKFICMCIDEDDFVQVLFFLVTLGVRLKKSENQTMAIDILGYLVIKRFSHEIFTDKFKGFLLKTALRKYFHNQF